MWAKERTFQKFEICGVRQDLRTGDVTRHEVRRELYAFEAELTLAMVLMGGVPDGHHRNCMSGGAGMDISTTTTSYSQCPFVAWFIIPRRMAAHVGSCA